MTEEQIGRAIEDAYSHVPTLPGYFVALEPFSEALTTLLPREGGLPWTPEEVRQLLLEYCPAVKFEDNYVNEAFPEVRHTFRLLPKKFPRRSALQQYLGRLVDAVPGDADGWKPLSAVEAAVDPAGAAMLEDLRFQDLATALRNLHPTHVEWTYPEDGSEPLVRSARRQGFPEADPESRQYEGGGVRSRQEHARLGLLERIIRAMGMVPADADGWVDCAPLGAKLGDNWRECLHALGESTLSAAIRGHLGDALEVRKKDPYNAVSPVLVRLLPQGNGDPWEELRVRLRGALDRMQLNPEGFADLAPVGFHLGPDRNVLLRRLGYDKLARAIAEGLSDEFELVVNDTSIAGGTPVLVRRRPDAVGTIAVAAEDAQAAQAAEGAETDAEPVMASAEGPVQEQTEIVSEVQAPMAVESTPAAAPADAGAPEPAPAPAGAPAAAPVPAPAVSVAPTNAHEALLQFAVFMPVFRGGQKVDGMEAALEQLARKALPEDWDFGRRPQGGAPRRYPILHNYLTQTFDRLCWEDSQLGDGQDAFSRKIRVSPDGQNAVFNTGLVDNLYEPIYAYFRTNPKAAEGKSPWLFVKFVSSSDPERGDLFVKYGSSLPPTANYYTSTAELVYDNSVTRERILTSPTHILRRCYRMPEAYLRRLFPDLPTPLGVRDVAFGQAITRRIVADQSLQRRIMDDVNMAITSALKRVQWNFKNAVPIYFPADHTISLLLPLSMAGDGRADVAITLTRVALGTGEVGYMAKTLLTTRMAYLDARLITRLDNDWLTATKL